MIDDERKSFYYGLQSGYSKALTIKSFIEKREFNGVQRLKGSFGWNRHYCIQAWRFNQNSCIWYHPGFEFLIIYLLDRLDTAVSACYSEGMKT